MNEIQRKNPSIDDDGDDMGRMVAAEFTAVAPAEGTEGTNNAGLGDGSVPLEIRFAAGEERGDALARFGMASRRGDGRRLAIKMDIER
jgi:hypothetical protein